MMPSDGERLRAVEFVELSARTLELEESSGMVEEGEIVDIDGGRPLPLSARN